MKRQWTLALVTVLGFSTHLAAVDPQLGFPITQSVTMGPPTVAELDGDPSLEVLVGSLSGGVFAFNADGSAVPGWPTAENGGHRLPPLVGDLVGDSTPEVFAVSGNPRSLRLFDRFGQQLPGWPILINVEPKHVALANVVGDEKLEVVTVEGDTVTVYLGDGSVASGWPVQLSISGAAMGLAIGDLEFDGSMEIVVSTAFFDSGAWMPSPVFVLENDGSVRSGWPVTPGPTGSRTMGPPTIADLDGDGTCEIMGQFHSLYILRANGFAFQPPVFTQGVAQVTCANLDEDPELEIVVPGAFALTILDIQSGTTIASSLYSDFQAAAVADVDGNGCQEIAVWSRGHPSLGVQAVHLLNDGLSNLPDWPLEMPYSGTAGPWGLCLADLDGDLDVEIIYVDELTLHVWDQGAATGGTPSFEWAQVGHDARRTNNYHGDELGLPRFIRCDGNRDGSVDVSDVIWLLRHLFLSGAPDPCPARLDFDNNGVMDLVDITGLLGHLLVGGPPPQPPFPHCGAGIGSAISECGLLPCQ